MVQDKTDKTRQEEDKIANEAKNDGTKSQAKPIPFPTVEFSTFILSLNTSALLHLGDVADPATGEKKKDLILAKHTIDTLGMLREKTVNNLNDDEKRLLETILFDLRLRFVKASS
ncbi:MAG: DUF1844 domain-containing protein [Desulfobacteraceae bacterium]|nr:DUF1844 domain-containing protein [Desulfobacteraceae bacterium]